MFTYQLGALLGSPAYPATAARGRSITTSVRTSTGMPPMLPGVPRKPGSIGRMGFDGFPKETVRFLSDLRKNNDKKWFDAHREEYERSFIGPAKSFVEAIGGRLRKLDADVHAEPRVNGSILRINRDV